MKPLLLLALACLSCFVSHRNDLPPPNNDLPPPKEGSPCKEYNQPIEDCSGVSYEPEKMKALYDNKEYKKAGQSFECFNVLSPNKALLYNAAQSYYMRGEYETDQRALFLFEEVLRLYPDSEETARAGVQTKINTIMVRSPPQRCDI